MVQRVNRKSLVLRDGVEGRRTQTALVVSWFRREQV
jgi:hypothetical protein